MNDTSRKYGVYAVEMAWLLRSRKRQFWIQRVLVLSLALCVAVRKHMGKLYACHEIADMRKDTLRNYANTCAMFRKI
jgi:hypothetical protein